MYGMCYMYIYFLSPRRTFHPGHERLDDILCRPSIGLRPMIDIDYDVYMFGDGNAAPMIPSNSHLLSNEQGDLSPSLAGCRFYVLNFCIHPQLVANMCASARKEGFMQLCSRRVK